MLVNHRIFSHSTFDMGFNSIMPIFFLSINMLEATFRLTSLVLTIILCSYGIGSNFLLDDHSLPLTLPIIKCVSHDTNILERCCNRKNCICYIEKFIKCSLSRDFYIHFLYRSSLSKDYMYYVYICKARFLIEKPILSILGLDFTRLKNLLDQTSKGIKLAINVPGYARNVRKEVKRKRK